MTLQQLATHIREEAAYRISENMSPTMTVLIPIESVEEIAQALEATTNRLPMMMEEQAHE